MSRGYVAAKIRAHTARKNGDEAERSLAPEVREGIAREAASYHRRLERLLVDHDWQAVGALAYEASGLIQWYEDPAARGFLVVYMHYPLPGFVAPGPNYWQLNHKEKLAFLAGEAKAERAKANPTGAREQLRGDWTIFHADHGIAPRQLDYIKRFLQSAAPQGFFILQFTLPPRLGKVPNALYGPASGDDPVPRDRVTPMKRGDPNDPYRWPDPMIDLPPRPVRFGQAIGMRTGDDFKLFTVYGGPLAPQNPGDPSNPDPDAAAHFWSQHALSSHQW